MRLRCWKMARNGVLKSSGGADGKSASAFVAAGIGKGDRVSIWAPNSKEWIVIALGALTVGAAIVPLNTRLKGREAGEILGRTKAKLLFTVNDFLDTDYPALIADQDLPDLEKVLLVDGGLQSFLSNGKGADDPAVDNALAALSPDDVFRHHVHQRHDRRAEGSARHPWAGSSRCSAHGRR